MPKTSPTLTQEKVQELRFAEIRFIRISELNLAQALFERIIEILKKSSNDKNSKAKYTKTIELLEALFVNSEFMSLGIAHQKQISDLSFYKKLESNNNFDWNEMKTDIGTSKTEFLKLYRSIYKKYLNALSKSLPIIEAAAKTDEDIRFFLNSIRLHQQLDKIIFKPLKKENIKDLNEGVKTIVKVCSLLLNQNNLTKEERKNITAFKDNLNELKFSSTDAKKQIDDFLNMFLNPEIGISCISAPYVRLFNDYSISKLITHSNKNENFFKPSKGEDKHFDDGDDKVSYKME